MRLTLLPLALSASLLAPFTVSAAEQGVTNLTPNFDFNNADTPLHLAGQAANSWNLPLQWVHDNVINGDIDATGGAIVLSGGAPVQNNPGFYRQMNENARLIDLGGTCGKVWAMNWAGSRLKETLESVYGIEADVTSPGLGLLVGWYQKPHYILIPDPAVMKEKAGKKLRCRIEMNIFKNEPLDDNCFYGYRMDDQGNLEDADYTLANANQVRFSDFYTDGQWDATRWMVYEFEFGVPEAPENLADWVTAPRIKIETDGVQNSCLMFRGITIYDPAETPDAAPVDRAAKVFNTYTVGADESDPDPAPGPDDPEDPWNNADDISGNRFFSSAFRFNEAAAPLKISARNVQDWNLPSGWVRQNFIAGDNYEEGGSMAISGSYVITNDDQACERVNEHIHLADLGGECGKVWALNFYNTNLAEELSTRYTVNFPEGGFVPVEGWETKYNLWLIPDWKELAAEAVGASKTLRVRMEVNLFDNDGSEDMQMKAWGVSDAGVYSEADYEYASSHPLKASEFINGMGQWDPTRWRAYEFDIDMPQAPEDGSEWRECPVVKVDLAGCAKGTLLIRNVFIWNPEAEAGRAVSAQTRETEKWVRYSVKSLVTGAELVEVPEAGIFTVDGSGVTFAEDAVVFDFAGRSVADCAAGRAVGLPAGFYMARTVSGATVKFAVR